MRYCVFFRDISLKEKGKNKIAPQGELYMDNDKSKPRETIFRRLHKKRLEQANRAKQSVELTPALPDLGTAPCPVCGHQVTVFVTRTRRPFINCGYCSARIFYNGRESMRRLKDVTKPVRDR